jgi:hypothetical protein
MSNNNIGILIGLIIILVIILLWIEYRTTDSIREKRSSYWQPDIASTDTDIQAIRRVIAIIRSNNRIVFWRQALIIAIIIPVPITYLITNRFPTWSEWLLIGVFTFLGIYITYSWMWAHFFNPNALTIERNLRAIEERITRKY